MNERWFKPGMVAVGIVLAIVMLLLAACEGEVFRVDLTNDTEVPLQFRLCIRENCNNNPLEGQVQPGGHYPANFTVGILTFWEVQDEEGNVLGCFRIDAPDERPDYDVLYVSKDLVPCP